MMTFKKTVGWSAAACAAVFALVVWNVGEKQDDGGNSPAAKTQAAESDGRKETRWSFGEWGRPWGLLRGNRESQTERTADPEEVEKAVRKTFLAYNAQELQTFKDGWTEKGFERAHGRPKEKVGHFGLLGLLSFRPYTIGEFANTAVYGKGASTEVELTYGEVEESHRLSLVWERQGWRIDHDEKLNQSAKDATVVDVKLSFFNIQLDRTRMAPGTVEFRIANTDNRKHEFIVKKVIPESEMEENVGLINPLAPGQNETLTLQLKPGRYVALCNLVTADATPYSTGMRVEFTVEQGG